MAVESPPRARGRVPAFEQLRRDAGITPACAGKSRCGWKRRSQRRNHPCVRGEEARPGVRAESTTESPPRARGRVLTCPGRSESVGITPACAGKRRNKEEEKAPVGNHPRVRGEEQGSAAGLFSAMESPPHARGRALAAAFAVAAIRITPACAGKSRRQLRPRHGHRNHPRARGEEIASPPMPGCPDRITPACAGKSGNPRFIDEIERNHPRVRGEELYYSDRGRFAWELPPRARGRAAPLRGSQRVAGITPACAGKSTRRPAP